ncbi:MAG: glycoside hydrolase family 19 protein [Candidatus Pacearchaeota archaeon]|jgi:putative chitinase|nr:glycoside hydrolase family 19 protein [Clostridia bacterium]
MVTKEQIKSLSGVTDETALTSIVKGLNDTLTKYEINTPLRICHFLSQVLHESGKFHFIKENLNYSADGLNKTFKKYFPTLESATPYARNQEKIANKVYASRMGNGDEKSGDGFKYKGRGFLQLTGKENYAALAKDTGVDFVNHPELLESYEYASLSAGWFWNKNKLNSIADKDDVLTLTKRINGGTIGLEDRKALLILCKKAIK